MEAGPAVGMVEPPALKEARRPGVVGVRAGPEDAHLPLDLLVGDAGVVGHAAARHPGELGEDVGGRVEVELMALSEPAGQVADDPPVGAGLPGRVDRLADADHSPLGARDSALVLLVQRAREDQVRVARRLREEEVDGDEEVEPLEGLLRERGVRQGDQRVEADGDEAADFPAVNHLHDLRGGRALAGQRALGDAPGRGHLGPVSRVLDVARPRELIAALALLACPLAVALPGDRRVARARLADLAGGEHEVDAGEHVLDALGVVLDAARVEQHGARRLHPQLGRLDDASRGDAHQPLHGLGRVAFDEGSHLVEARRVPLDEVVVHAAEPDDRVQDGVHQRRVSPGAHRQVEVGGAGDGGEARVDDDELRAPVARPPDVVGGDGAALRDVRAEHHHEVGAHDVGPRVGRTVDAEGPQVAGPRGDHAEAPVVVDVPRADREARELAHQVRLLVGERRTGEHGDAVPPVAGLEAPDALGDEVEGLVPRDAAEAAAGAHERVEQAVGVVVLEIALDALRAELSLVERELLPGLDADHPLVLHEQRDAALLTAEAAVRVDLPVGRGTGGEAAGWLVAEVGAEGVGERLGRSGETRHPYAASGRAADAAGRGWNCAPRSSACAVATWRRRQAGHRR